MILFINACARKNSRTKRLADYLLSKMNEPVQEVRLSEIVFPVTDDDFLALRNRLTANGDFSNQIFDLAKQFADADRIIIAAPFWDLSFPASLKQYFEQINVLGITFVYTQDGQPKGLCKAQSLHYVTTVGGNFFPEEYGFGYIKALAENFYGITDVKLIKAIGLDIYGADVERIIQAAMDEIG